MSDGFFDTLPATKPRKPKAPDTRPLEKEVQKRIVNALERRDFIVHRINSGQFIHEGRHIGGAKAGTSDLIGCTPTGRYFALEVKRLGEKPTDKQLAYLESVRAAGGIAGWADNVPMALELFGYAPSRWEQNI